MAFGVPVIGTSVGGIGEMLEDGGGILVPAKDEAALSDAMLRYLRDGSLRDRDGKRALERASAEFDATTHAARIREQIGIAVFGESSH
jgi:glycosyltransferase involved in cell wall biosynthesis